MKILLVSDTHYQYTWKQVDDILNVKFDCCVCLGDVENLMIDYLAEKCKEQDIPIYVLDGNHDNYKDLENEYVNFIHMKSFKLGDYNCFGFGGSHAYKPKNDMEMLWTQEDSIQLLNDIDNVDTLFTHDSISINKLRFTNKKLRNLLINTFLNACNHPGLIGITNLVKKCNPKYHFHGHHHRNLKYQYRDTVCQCIHGFKIVEI